MTVMLLSEVGLVLVGLGLGLGLGWVQLACVGGAAGKHTPVNVYTKVRVKSWTKWETYGDGFIPACLD